MKFLIKGILALTMIAMLPACASTSAKAPGTVDLPSLPVTDPNRVPEQMSVFNEQLVLALTFKAATTGYSLVQKRKVLGRPAKAVNLSRDVLIVAKDVEGNIVSKVSVDNPRTIRSVGGKSHDVAVAASGTFTVTFGNPDLIKKVEVSVVRGPNSDMKREFAVE